MKLKTFFLLILLCSGGLWASPNKFEACDKNCAGPKYTRQTETQKQELVTTTVETELLPMHQLPGRLL